MWPLSPLMVIQLLPEIVVPAKYRPIGSDVNHHLTASNDAGLCHLARDERGVRGAAPTLVTMPAASAKPSTSAVLVSGRIRITGSPEPARRRPPSDEKVARPVAIPPDAAIPVKSGLSAEIRET